MASPSKKVKTEADHPPPRPRVAPEGSGTWARADGYGFATDLVHGCVKPDEKTGAILTPIFQSTTFVQPSIEEYLSSGYSYSRTANPTVKALEDKIAL
jgi:O-acetylhomoserine/O-acetylserine sulfhydrylase-like pyridoxal-dependent enzyme